MINIIRFLVLEYYDLLLSVFWGLNMVAQSKKSEVIHWLSGKWRCIFWFCFFFFFLTHEILTKVLVAPGITINIVWSSMLLVP